MEVKVSFDIEELMKWYDEDCGIECENCPLEGHVCDTLLSAAYEEYCREVWNDENYK